MLFSPSACLGGTAAPMAWHLAVTEHGPLFLQLVEAQEPALAAYADPSERVAREQRMAQAATDEFPGWAKGIAADGDDGRVQSVMEQPGANLQPRLTGPLLPRAQAPQGPGCPGPAVRAFRSATPMYAAPAAQRLSWA
jgi:hypothetical protein